MLEKQYQSLTDAAAGMEETERGFYDRGDRRAVFLSIYLMVTRRIESAIGTQFFEDGAWVERYGVSFANFYRRALRAFEAGSQDEVPKAWRYSFDTSRAGTNLVAHDLLLGINAHVNNDLPQALDEVGIDPDREKRYRDHTKVNEILTALMDPVQDELARVYAPGLALIDKSLGPLDERISLFSIERARQSAWESAVSLVNARSSFERGLVKMGIESKAALLARLVLAPAGMQPWLTDALRHLEKGIDWRALMDRAMRHKIA